MIHLHGGYYRTLIENNVPVWQRKSNYKALERVAGAIVLGPSLKWIFEGMIPEKKIYIVPNCVDHQYLMNDEEFHKKLQGINNREVKHVLYLSNFIRSKGYPEVLELAVVEKKYDEAGKNRRFHFDFAGEFFEKEEEQFFGNYIKEHKLEKYVTYHGFVGGEEKRELLKSCDFFVLPTRYPNEGQPISIIEAMGNGMIIVTTDHAGIPDLVKDGINGIVIKEEFHAQQIYRKLLEADSNMVLTNRRAVLDCYMEKYYLQNMKDVFSEV